MASDHSISTPPVNQKTPRPSGDRRGLVMVYTGNGKGKTTAALGLLVRAAGRGLETFLYQFIKHEGAKFGEHRSLDRLGLSYEGLGDGFSWTSRDLDQSRRIAAEGWARVRETILSGQVSLVVLDEITYPLNWGWFPLEEVLETLRQRPSHVHVVLTGRDAPARLIEQADTVTEMTMVKHAFEANVPPQKGIEH